ncbi:MAG: 30S ribosomal protein S9 [bacterium]|nr:30S ribosomal protein S9 [bacterium]
MSTKRASTATSDAVSVSATGAERRDPALALSAVGRRKRAIARVRLFRNGSGKIVVNGQDCDTYFTMLIARATCKQPLDAVGQADKVDVESKIVGGGIRAQSDALRLGIARALCLLNPTFQRALRKVGYLTRDARIKERKKPGLKRARRAPQWAKR